ncbi:MAG: sugar phosphate isomerase/epimerase [Acidobacteria bacterium]|nr:sugar phosphate isomerase/epimerase [Acidobacteriota bacterium]
MRDLLGKDFEGTLRQLAAIGYKSIEMCSPHSYSKSDFGTLADRKPSDVRAAIRAAGLICESCHYNFGELKENLEERIRYAKQLGLKQMILASFGLPADATVAEWERAAAELNRIGERVRKAGLQLGFHNHNREFEKVDGVLPYDRLLAELDPKLVKLQFQTAVVSIGYEAVPYLEKYPGRFISLHLADWSPTEKKVMPVGAGAIDWKKLFAAARNAGVKNYFVEVDLEAMKASYPYLHQLDV